MNLRVIKTHEANQDGTACALCGAKFPKRRAPWKPGTLVGLIEGDFVKATAYKVGLNDSNPRCKSE
jgi:hypothetical protein